MSLTALILIILLAKRQGKSTIQLSQCHDIICSLLPTPSNPVIKHKTILLSTIVLSGYIKLFIFECPTIFAANKLPGSSLFAEAGQVVAIA